MPPPAAVLFACNLNRVRSPMAAALLRRRMGDRVFVDSCGLVPAEGVDPFAVAVMLEIGLDLSGHEAKTFDVLEDSSFDRVISLTEPAHRYAEEMARTRAVELEYWPIEDPTLEEGPREQRLQGYRRVRDSLDRKLSEWVSRGALEPSS